MGEGGAGGNVWRKNVCRRHRGVWRWPVGGRGLGWGWVGRRAGRGSGVVGMDGARRAGRQVCAGRMNLTHQAQPGVRLVKF